MSRSFISNAIIGAWLLLAPTLIATEQSTNRTAALQNPLLPRCATRVSLPSRATEAMEGEAALAHVRNLKAKAPKAWARAEALLLAKGYKPTAEAVVLRSTSLARMQTKARTPFAFAQETIHDASGEVTFWSWDDGQDGTWEGTIHMADYENGLEALADAQIYFDTPDFYPLWEETVYVEGTPGHPDNQTTMRRAVSVLQLASIGRVQSPLLLAQGCGARLVQDWSWCMAPGCGWVMHDCAKARLLRGPAFVSCVKWGCGAIAIGCAGPALLNAYNCRRR